MTSGVGVQAVTDRQATNQRSVKLRNPFFFIIFLLVANWLLRLVGADEASFDMACRLDVPFHEHCLHRVALENRWALETTVASYGDHIGFDTSAFRPA